MGVDYTAKTAYGRPVKFSPEHDGDEVEEGLPDDYDLVRFGFGNYGGDHYYVLSCGGAGQASSDGKPTLITTAPTPFDLTDEQIREMGLEPTGEVGWYVGLYVW